MFLIGKPLRPPPPSTHATKLCWLPLGRSQAREMGESFLLLLWCLAPRKTKAASASGRVGSGVTLSMKLIFKPLFRFINIYTISVFECQKRSKPKIQNYFLFDLASFPRKKPSRGLIMETQKAVCIPCQKKSTSLYFIFYLFFRYPEQAKSGARHNTHVLNSPWILAPYKPVFGRWTIKPHFFFLSGCLSYDDILDHFGLEFQHL